MLIKQGEKMINKNTIIRVITHDSDHEFIGTKSEAKKYYLKFALENRNKELTYSEDIRRFTLDELIWFVFGGNVLELFSHRLLVLLSNIRIHDCSPL